MNEFSVKFNKPHGRDWRSFLVRRKFVDPLATKTFNTMLDIFWAKKKLLMFGL